jgi:hypothetical protein
VLSTHPVLMKPLAWVAQGASSVKEASDQWLQVLADGLGWMTAFIQTVWGWSGDQIGRMTHAPWDSWPLWKQLLFAAAAALVIYTLFVAARQLWWAAMNVLYAVASFVGVLIVTLPTILLAGAIALAGLWAVNNLDSLSSLRSMMTLPGHDTGPPDGRGAVPAGAPPARHAPAPRGGADKEGADKGGAQDD